MNLRRLKYFCRIIEFRNMTQAAASLCIAQPALSQQIAQLENSLGVQLLVRGPKGVQPTDAGTILYRQAQTILRQVDITSRLITQNRASLTGAVSIALASSTARILVLPLLQKIKEKLPGIIVEIVNVPSSELITHVIQGRVDLALSPDQEDVRGIETSPILLETLFLLTNADWQYNGNTVPIKDISKLPLMLPRLPNKVRSRVDHAFLSNRKSYNLYAEASTAAIIIPAVKAGITATILPYAAAWPEIINGEIVASPLDLGLAREIVLCHGPSDYLSPAAQQITVLLLEQVKELVEEQTWQGCKLLF